MEGNKDEANRCIEEAENCIKTKNIEKALKFLYRAEKMYPSQKAKDLLTQIESDPTNSRKKPQETEEDIEDPAVDCTKQQEKELERIKKCKDLYEILGVNKNASGSEINAAYKKLALKTHPDKNRCPGSCETFQTIRNAFAVLTDPEKRNQYDSNGTKEASSSSSNQYNSTREFDLEKDILPVLIFAGMAGIGICLFEYCFGSTERNRVAKKEDK